MKKLFASALVAAMAFAALPASAAELSEVRSGDGKTITITHAGTAASQSQALARQAALVAAGFTGAIIILSVSTDTKGSKS